MNTIYLLTAAMLASAYLQIATATVTMRNRTKTGQVVELIMNERTSFTTSNCGIKGGREFVLEFKRVGSHARDIKKFYVHAENTKTGVKQTRDLYKCKWIDKHHEYFCTLWYIRQREILYCSSHPCNYTVWATRGKDPYKEQIWEYGKPFELAKHLFSCLGTVFNYLESKVHQNTIDITWHLVNSIAGHFGPRFEVIVDNKIYSNKTRGMRNLKETIEDVDTCVPHRICVRVMYDVPFQTKYLKTQSECIDATETRNCTISTPLPTRSSVISIHKSEWFILASVVAVFGVLTFLVSWYCKRNTKKKKNNEEAENDNEPILPRNDKLEDEDIAIRVITTPRYAEIDGDGNVANDVANDNNADDVLMSDGELQTNNNKQLSDILHSEEHVNDFKAIIKEHLKFPWLIRKVR